MEAQKFRYSIILPVRNGGEYVKECVTGILNQSFQQFNLHVLDNASADGTLEWISSLKDNRIIIHPSAKTLSMEENWGRITTIEKNEFMTIIGHDDILDTSYLSVMDNLIQKHPRATLYQAHFRFIDNRGIIIRRSKQMPEIQSVSELMASIFTDSLDTMGTGYMMKARDYEAIGGIQAYPNLLFADHELWFNLTAISYKATAMEECFSFRIHQSVSRMSVAVKYIRAFFRFMDYLFSFAQRNDEVRRVIEEHITGYILYYCRSLAHRLLRTPARQREGMTVSSFINKCKEYAEALVPGKKFEPYRQFNIRLAKQIDSNIFSRQLYLLFKKFYRRPIYS